MMKFNRWPLKSVKENRINENTFIYKYFTYCVFYQNQKISYTSFKRVIKNPVIFKLWNNSSWFPESETLSVRYYRRLHGISI